MIEIGGGGGGGDGGRGKGGGSEGGAIAPRKWPDGVDPTPGKQIGAVKW